MRTSGLTVKHLLLFQVIFDHTIIGSFQKRSTLPTRRKFLPSGEGGETKLFPLIVNVLGHPKGVGGLTSNFFCGGGMDVFWNDPYYHSFFI
jgi:hypothetical protein